MLKILDKSKRFYTFHSIHILLTAKVFCTPSPWTKLFKRIFCRSINNTSIFIIQNNL